MWLQITNISNLPGLVALTVPNQKGSYPSANKLNLARFIKINGLTDHFSDKVLACKAYLSSISLSWASLTPVEIYCSAVSALWRHIFTPFDIFKADYLIELAETVIML
jgi:hypothetical protein